jgi:hypothetical protein
MTELRKRQFEFNHKLELLYGYIHSHGYNCVTDEVNRPPELSRLYAEQNKGRHPSIHELKLAADIDIFKADDPESKIPLSDGKLFQDIGEYWESIGGTWGGRWGDGRHFSHEYRWMK